jgi:histidinol-phosphate aminotransferase
MKGKPTAGRWVREIIQQQSSYHVPQAGDYIKLDAMENPWPMPAAINQAWRDSLAALQLNRYPDPQAGEVVQRLRAVMDIPDTVAVMPGNGSDELIQVIMMALAGEDKTVLAPSPSFVMYEVLARACGLTYVDVPLKKNFTLDMTAMQEAIARHQPAVIFLASPNNPTGVAYRQTEIEAILELAPGLVVVDEAYQPFASNAGGSYMSRIADYPDLIVMRTLSKVGLAGIRLGLIAGHVDWLTELDKLRLPYNINTLTQATALFALDHWSVFQQQIEMICVQRERVYNVLSAIPGVFAWPSETNFILFRLSTRQAVEVHAQLLKQGIMIKCLHREGTALDNCLRVTIGREDENGAFLTALAALLEIGG